MYIVYVQVGLVLLAYESVYYMLVQSPPFYYHESTK